jgi:hypothetical protein
MDFFENDCDSFTSDEDICNHDIIDDNYCKLCGVMMGTIIVLDDINTDDGPPIKKIIQNVELLETINDMDMDHTAKNILLEQVEKSTLIIKNSADALSKLLFTYGYCYLIRSGVIECTPVRWSRLCNRPITTAIIELMENSLPPEYNTPKIFMPTTFVKEFLYDIYNPMKIPDKYPTDIITDKACRFCDYLILRRKITHAYDDCPPLEIKGRDGFNAYPALNHDMDHNPLPRDEAEDRMADLNALFLSDADLVVRDEDVIFDLPQRIAATSLFNLLQINLDNVYDIDMNGKMLTIEAGEPLELPYNDVDLWKYFNISIKTLTTLSNNYGVKLLKVRSRRNKVKISRSVSSRRPRK